MNKTPKLRFPEFSGEWEEDTLSKVSDVRDGTHDSPRYVEEGFPFITSKNLLENGKLDFSNVTYINKDDFDNYNKRSKVDKGDILFGMIGTIGNPAIVDREGFAIKNVALIKEKIKLKNSYLIQLLKSNIISRKFYKLNVGGTQKFIALGVIRDLLISIPAIEEQEKLASFFSLIDDKIEKQQKKVEALEEYKKGMLQKIFSREIRFKKENEEDYPEWEKGTMREIISEDLHPIEKPNTAYWRLGIRSHGKGTFHEFITDPSQVDMATLYEVKKNGLVVNITFAWEHAIAITDEVDEGKLVSHRFPTYKFKNNAYYKFYKYYLLRPIFKYQLSNASPGGAGRNRVLNKKQFLEIPTIIPTVEEQSKIARFLSKIDEKLEKEQQKLEALNQWKKGLLQQMFV